MARKADPANDSVTDSTLTNVIQMLARAMSADDPAGQVFGMATTGVPSAGKAGGLVGAIQRKLHPSGFYSRVDEAVPMVPEKGVPAQGVLNRLRKAPGGVAQEELDYRKLSEFIQGKGNQTVTRAELKAFLDANPAPFPEVKTLGEVPAELISRQDDLGARTSAAFDRAFPSATTHGRPWSGDQLSQLDDMNARHWAWQAAGGDPEAIAKLNRLAISPERRAAILEYGRLANETRVLNEQRLTNYPRQKYGQYQVPGGENYRETLLTLPGQPHNPYEAFTSQMETKYGVGYDTARLTPDEQATQSMLWDRSQRTPGAITESQFKSSHFDEPNILVHTRSNDRALPTGSRGRFVEEVQSDWHQAGKSKGYDTPQLAELKAKYVALREQPGGFPDTNPEARALRDRLRAAGGGQGVPDAPFKDAWPDLGLKQQLIEAANDPRAEWMGVTSGQTQAARYDLSKQISEIHYSGTNLKAYGHDGETVISQSGISPQQLPDYIGKEAAEKLMAQPARGTLRSLEGVDLQVGGEGMRKFYDGLVPKRLDKIVKPFGGAVEHGPRMSQPGSRDCLRR
jgi:hypothetical protein